MSIKWCCNKLGLAHVIAPVHYELLLGSSHTFDIFSYFLIFLHPKPLLGINIDVIWLIIDFWSFPRPVVANLEAQNPQNSS